MRTSIRRPFTVIAASAALLLAGTVPAAAETSAQGFDPLICLSNSSAWCMHPYGGSTAGGTAVDVYNKNDSTNGDEWTFDQVGTFDIGYIEPAYEIHAGSTGECIGLSSLSNTSSDAALAPCGADGTVWVAAYFTDGYLLYSRYWLDTDSLYDPLAVAQLGNNQPVHVDPNYASDGQWLQWSY
jgi:hypothetical protein